MPLTYKCPYWGWDKYLETHCEMAVLKFQTPEARKKFIYQYCTSINGWQECSIAKILNEEYEKKGRA